MRPRAEPRQLLRWLARRRRRRVAVDLTPLRPGGENGGARLVALSLVEHFGPLAPDTDFVLLTSPSTHDELAGLELEQANVRRVQAGLEERAIESLAGRVDLVFCPFTAPLFFEPRAGLVCTVYDLQFAAHPEFFDDAERRARARQIRAAVALADRLVCISRFVRSTVLESTGAAPAQVAAVPLGLLRPLPDVGPRETTELLARLGLVPDQFLLYPANFWPHKNHARLFEALRLVRARRPGPRLVCSGVPGALLDERRQEAARAGVEDLVTFPGYLSEVELAALLRTCRALVYPSLYEGFGLPVLEAMACGRPVACSNAGALPEVAGSAALLFDPRLPAAMAEAIERLDADPRLRAELADRGRRRAETAGDGRSLACAYLALFEQVLARRAPRRNAVHGVDADGWSGGRIVVTTARGAARRKLELELWAPDWLPDDGVRLCARHSARPGRRRAWVARGSVGAVALDVPRRPGFLDIHLQPVVSPLALGHGDDRRLLSAHVRGCRLVGPDGVIDLLGA
jgi:glycosyltransferase involved in cell wall biosynthesis